MTTVPDSKGVKPSEIGLYFQGYLFFDNLSRTASVNDIYSALDLNSPAVTEKRCFFYTEHFQKMRCAVAKYNTEDEAKKSLQKYNNKTVLGNKISVLEMESVLSNFLNLEQLLAADGTVGDFLETYVLVYINDSGKNVKHCSEKVLNIISPFGPIKTVQWLGPDDYSYANYLVCFRYYTTALACQLAFNQTFVGGNLVTVSIHRKRPETCHDIINLSLSRGNRRGRTGNFGEYLAENSMVVTENPLVEGMPGLPILEALHTGYEDTSAVASVPRDHAGVGIRGTYAGSAQGAVPLSDFVGEDAQKNALLFYLGQGLEGATAANYVERQKWAAAAIYLEGLEQAAAISRYMEHQQHAAASASNVEGLQGAASASNVEGLQGAAAASNVEGLQGAAAASNVDGLQGTAAGTPPVTGSSAEDDRQRREEHERTAFHASNFLAAKIFKCINHTEPIVEKPLPPKDPEEPGVNRVGNINATQMGSLPGLRGDYP